MKSNHSTSDLARSLGALGVVYGDIGTSVLYAFKECLTHGLKTETEIIGVLSLIIWSLFTLVSVKYLSLIMRADNQGEGGILALLSLAFPSDIKSRGKAAAAMTAVGIAGAALLYGDGVITPAISVLSAVEGLLTATDKIRPVIIPLTIVILIALFSVQSKGTGAIGQWFGRVMLAWFTTLAVLGVIQIAQYPMVLHALNPLNGATFLLHHGKAGLVIMGSVFLVVTGGEALYADMGHFGRKPIARAWTFLVCPALILNYLGQGALAITHPEAQENPFFNMAPGWLLYPLIALATTAAIIASQALISGAFSLTMQGIQMGYIPRMEIRHTSKSEHGQIYIPRINVILAIGCIALVLGFQTSTALASAYGIAVTLTMLATTTIFFFASQRLWKWSPLQAGVTCLIFGAIEAVFFFANALKILSGGWFPLVAGAVIFIIMVTWRDGRTLLQKSLPPGMPLDDFIASIAIAGAIDEQHKLHRSQGTAVFLASNPTGTPNALIKNIKHNQILHQKNILLTISTDSSLPYVSSEQRVTVIDKGEGFYRITAKFGFMESPKIKEVFDCVNQSELAVSIEKTTFFIGKENIVVTEKAGMALWREHLFVLLSKHSENAADYFQLPPNRVYEVSQVVEI